MKLIIDANIIISGLIKDSTNRKIILSPKFEYFSPEFLLKELNKYYHEYFTLIILILQI
ncbi:MAG: PIN domain-containing protein [Promethearchaeota archaeon]